MIVATCCISFVFWKSICFSENPISLCAETMKNVLSRAYCFYFSSKLSKTKIKKS